MSKKRNFEEMVQSDDYKGVENLNDQKMKKMKIEEKSEFGLKTL